MGRFTLTKKVNNIIRLRHDTYECMIEVDKSTIEGRCLKTVNASAGKAWYSFGMSNIHSCLLNIYGEVPRTSWLGNHFYMVTEPFVDSFATYSGPLLTNDKLLSPEFATILSDVMAAILFIFDRNANHGDISSNNVYIVQGVNGLRAKVGKMGVRRGCDLKDGLCDDLRSFAQMIEDKFLQKQIVMTSEVKIFLKMLRNVSARTARRHLTIAINHIVLAPPEGRCTFRLIAWQKGLESRAYRGVNNIPLVVCTSLKKMGLYKANWIAELPSHHEIPQLKAYTTPQSNPEHNFMYLSRAFTEHANDPNINVNLKTDKKATWGEDVIDKKLNEAYDGFLAAWYQACACDQKMSFSSFRQL